MSRDEVAYDLGEVVVCTIEGELNSLSTAGIVEERGMLGFGEGIMSTRSGMFISVL